MADQDVKFIPFEVAQKVIGSVMEEEHPREDNRRVLSVYDINNRQLCWFDHDDIMAEVESKTKEAAVEHIMHHIPVWAVKEILAGLKK